MEKGLRYMVKKIRGDSQLSVVYSDYLNRIEANCSLYLNLLANDGKLNKLAFKYLSKSVKDDFSVIFTMRFLRSLRRTLMNIY
jgi:hypothetical protein